MQKGGTIFLFHLFLNHTFYFLITDIFLLLFCLDVVLLDHRYLSRSSWLIFTISSCILSIYLLPADSCATSSHVVAAINLAQRYRGCFLALPLAVLIFYNSTSFLNYSYYFEYITSFFESK